MTFLFQFENKGQNHDRHAYNVEDASHAELYIAVYNDDRRVSREVLGTVLKGKPRGPALRNEAPFSQRSWDLLSNVSFLALMGEVPILECEGSFPLERLRGRS